jgi:hypothetical protein
MKLKSIQQADDGIHKYVATFERENGSVFRTKFGAKGYRDYTDADTTREVRDAYRRRHERDLETGDPTRAGFLSYYLLWGPSKTLSRNITAYRRKFGL